MNKWKIKFEFTTVSKNGAFTGRTGEGLAEADNKPEDTIDSRLCIAKDLEKRHRLKIFMLKITSVEPA